MKWVDDGGSAFPMPRSPMHHGAVLDSVPGMTLRDYFAAKVAVAAYRSYMDGTRHVDRDAASLASECYAVADAMIAARKVGAS